MLRTALELREVEENRQGSQFIEGHYEELAKAALGWGVDPTKMYDIVNDVYISVKRAEENGEGYDPNKGNSEYIELGQFIFQRVKLYARNRKYRRPSGGDIEVPSCGGGDDIIMDRYQMAYEMACQYDTVLIDEEDCASELPALLEEYSDVYGDLRTPIKYILDNLSAIRRGIEDKLINPSIFDGLKELCEEPEIMDCIESLLALRRAGSDRYDAIVDSL